MSQYWNLGKRALVLNWQLEKGEKYSDSSIASIIRPKSARAFSLPVPPLINPLFTSPSSTSTLCQSPARKHTWLLLKDGKDVVSNI